MCDCTNELNRLNYELTKIYEVLHLMAEMQADTKNKQEGISTGQGYWTDRLDEVHD